MKSINTRVAAAVALAVAATAAPFSTALAQAALEEVVVTAERRETSLQSTPLSIAALSADAMDRKGVTSVSDIALFTPNLAINGTRGNGNNSPSFAIRGISGGGGATSERGVALYIDDIYVPRTAGSVFKVFDLDRVEVLRGPQGTLFGRNSQGGAVRLITRQPERDFDAYLRVNVGNLNHHDIIGMVNLPLNDQFFLRLQAGHLEQDGYVTRGSQKMGGETVNLGRAQLLYVPNSDLSITLAGLFSDSKSNGSPNVMREWNMKSGITGVLEGNFADWMSDWLSAAGQPRLAAYNDSRLVKSDPYAAPDFCFIDNANPDFGAACEQKNDSRYYQFDAKVKYRLSDNADLTWTNGYANMDHSGITDWQFLGTEVRPDIVKSIVYNQELLVNWRLFGGKVDLVTGANFFRENSGTDAYNINARGTSVYNATPVAGSGVTWAGVPNGNGYAGLYISGNGAVDQVSRSFGQFNSLTWHATDKLNLTAGARVSLESKDYSATRRSGSGPAQTCTTIAGKAYCNTAPNDFVPNFPGSQGATSISVSNSRNWTEVDWRATVDYHLSQDVMAYATASKAFKAGQYSYSISALASGPSQSDVIQPIDPERVVNLEAGLRSTWFDGRLRVNPTVYHMAWTNRQSSQQQQCTLATDPTCPITGFRIVTVNSGNVDVYGVEVDAQWAITRNLSLDGAFGSTQYNVKDEVANKGPYLFPDQPTPTYNLGLTYTVPDTAWGKVTANLNYAYQGPQQTYPGSLTYPVNTIDSAYELPAYGLINARLQLTTNDKKNVISLYANNLADKVYATYATSFGGGYWDAGGGTATTAPAGVAADARYALQWVMGRPREFGIQIQHNF